MHHAATSETLLDFRACALNQFENWSFSRTSTNLTMIVLLNKLSSDCKAETQLWSMPLKSERNGQLKRTKQEEKEKNQLIHNGYFLRRERNRRTGSFATLERRAVISLSGNSKCCLRLKYLLNSNVKEILDDSKDG